jgi:2,5-diamino-6-(ribosylamino)-4(3H)-pyrimidinone 5'-phosphate reductase
MARLPFVLINTAMTADGKIAPANRHFVPFSSQRDQDLLLELRTRADAVLSGARTIDLTKVDLGPGGKKYQKQRVKAGLAEFNLRVIVSGSASVNPKAHIFTTRFSPIILLTTAAAPKIRRNRLAKLVDDMFVSPRGNLDFRAAFEWLREKWKVKRLLCEGGGEVNAALFRAKLVNELYLTISPVIFGGRNAPTLADGDGIERLEDAIRLKLKKLERIGDELYCVYRALN